MALWMMRAGRHGEYEDRFLATSRIYLTWGDEAFRGQRPVEGERRADLQVAASPQGRRRKVVRRDRVPDSVRKRCPNRPVIRSSFIRRCVRDRKLFWTYHVNMRLERRHITRDEILSAVDSYAIIESYPDDKYLASYLVAAPGSTYCSPSTRRETTSAS